MKIIPEMTHVLSSAWHQPSRSDIEIDNTHALMSKDTLNRLSEYSMSIPTGVYAGKMWKRKKGETWILCWYGKENNKGCPINYREVLLDEN